MTGFYFKVRNAFVDFVEVLNPKIVTITGSLYGAYDGEYIWYNHKKNILCNFTDELMVTL